MITVEKSIQFDSPPNTIHRCNIANLKNILCGSFEWATAFEVLAKKFWLAWEPAPTICNGQPKIEPEIDSEKVMKSTETEF